MTTLPRIDSFLPQHVRDRLLLHADRLFARGGRVMAVVEFTAQDRTEPFDYGDNDEDHRAARRVTLRITECEVATGKQEDGIRNVQQALHRIRTSKGTLEEHLLGVHEQTVEFAGAVLLGQEDGA